MFRQTLREPLSRGLDADDAARLPLPRDACFLLCFIDDGIARHASRGRFAFILLHRLLLVATLIGAYYGPPPRGEYWRSFLDTRAEPRYHCAFIFSHARRRIYRREHWPYGDAEPPIHFRRPRRRRFRCRRQLRDERPAGDYGGRFRHCLLLIATKSARCMPLASTSHARFGRFLAISGDIYCTPLAIIEQPYPQSFQFTIDSST